VRLFIKDSERRPDPAPVKTDDRKVVLVGLVLWIIALGVMLALLPQVEESGLLWLLWTVVVGFGLGLVLLVYTAKRHSD
jgi:FtsH-binding integral membrane protein